MTIVRISRGKPESGGIGPLGGKIQFTPTRGWIEEGAPEIEVLPHPFTVDVPPGTGYFEVTLKPTAPGWAWRAYAYGFGSLASRREHVLVPVSGPVYFHRLTRVDPKTLDPTVEPEAAWWAALEQGAYGVAATLHPTNPDVLRVRFPVWRRDPDNPFILKMPYVKEA